MAEKEVTKILAKPFATAAGIMGLIQALLWIAMTVLCICCYEEAIVVDFSDIDNHTNYAAIYNIFLNARATTDDAIIVTPEVFAIFMSIILALSIIWTIISGVILWTIIHNKWNVIKHIFTTWSVTTFLISLVDIVLVSLIAVDFRYEDQKTSNSIDVLIAYGVVLSVAARGYILWIFNVILAIIIGKFACDADSGKREEATRTFINAYDTSSIKDAPWSIANQQNTSRNPLANANAATPRPGDIIYDNSGHQNSAFERSDSFFPMTALDHDYITPLSQPNFAFDQSNFFLGNPQSNDNDQSSPVYATNYDRQMPRVAGIGKQGRRSPQGRGSPPIPVQSPNVPYIPPPDYTPPGTPSRKELKSVLRSQSNYYYQ